MSTIYDSVEDVKEILFGSNGYNIEDIRNEVMKDIQSGKATMPPQYLMMKITNKCNSNCVYCNHAANKIGREIKDQIPTEKILNILDEAANMGVKAVSISGGEPLVRDDVEVFVKKIVEHNMVPVLLTNGMLLKQRAKKLYENGLRYFIVSLDSLEEEKYFNQRGVHLESVLEGIEELEKIKKPDDSVKIHVTPVVTAKNISDMPEMIKQLSSRKIAVQISPYHDFYKYKDNELEKYDSEIVEKVIDKILKMKKEGYLIANSEAFLKHFNNFFNKKMIIPQNYNCLAGYVSVYVDTYENVLPCWSDSFKPIGNLKNESLKEIWYGAKYQEYRKKMYNCMCKGCWFLCTGELTILLNGEK